MTRRRRFQVQSSQSTGPEDRDSDAVPAMPPAGGRPASDRDGHGRSDSELGPLAILPLAAGGIRRELDSCIWILGTLRYRIRFTDIYPMYTISYTISYT